jgi:hypothetical protein
LEVEGEDGEGWCEGESERIAKKKKEKEYFRDNFRYEEKEKKTGKEERR